jgi:peptidoglycan/xylan/chitin deacetylase (PgdA/CDA1 family)
LKVAPKQVVPQNAAEWPQKFNGKDHFSWIKSIIKTMSGTNFRDCGQTMNNWAASNWAKQNLWRKIQFAPLFPVLHQILKPTFAHCLWRGNPERREIALTFDDGPHPRHTPALLDVLAEFNVKASFFWLGIQVERNPELAQQIYLQGHSLGLHGYDHKPFLGMGAQELRQTLSRTQAAIAHACNLAPEQVRDVRPPYGVFSPQTLKWLQEWGYRTVMWSVVPEDWLQPGIPVVLRRVLTQVNNGAIIVLHDGAQGGPDVVETTRQLLPQLIAQGYELVTIPQLWNRQTSPGAAPVLPQ